MRALLQKLRTADRDLLLFFAGAALFAMANGGMFEVALNNYLDDTFNISGTDRGKLELPRELPGFLVVFVAGGLFFLRDTRLMALAAGLTVVGLLGIAASGPRYGQMVASLMLASTGLHLLMPVGQGLAIRLSRRGRRATRLGQVGAAGAAGFITGCAVVWLARRLGADYHDLFKMGAVVGVLSCACYLLMRPAVVEEAQRRPKLIFRPRYMLFYVLCVLFGARKQAFLTFAPFVLIRIYGEPVETFAKLWMASSIIGIFFRPALGKIIDRVGERKVLMADAVVLLLITLSYGFADRWGLGRATVYVLYVCFVVDSVAFAVGMARTTYMNRIAERQSDLTPTLSLGISLNHAVSMTIPTLGGKIWDAAGLGFRFVFLGAALVAALTLGAASLVSERGRNERERSAGAAETLEEGPDAEQG